MPSAVWPGIAAEVGSGGTTCTRRLQRLNEALAPAFPILGLRSCACMVTAAGESLLLQLTALVRASMFACCVHACMPAS